MPLPFADESFDAVLCGFALFFFPDPARALGEIRRVLRGAGRLAVSTFAREGSASIASVWEDLSPFVTPPPQADNHLDFDEPEQLHEAFDNRFCRHEMGRHDEGDTRPG